MAMITGELYEGFFLGARQLRPTKSTMIHLFHLYGLHPLCGAFVSDAIFSTDDSCLGNPRCKSCRKYARKHFDGVA